MSFSYMPCVGLPMVHCPFLICRRVDLPLVHVSFSYLSMRQSTIGPCALFLSVHTSDNNCDVSFSYLPTCQFTNGPRVIFLFVHMVVYNWPTCHYAICPHVRLQLVHVSFHYLSTRMYTIGPRLTFLFVHMSDWAGILAAGYAMVDFMMIEGSK